MSSYFNLKSFFEGGEVYAFHVKLQFSLWHEPETWTSDSPSKLRAFDEAISLVTWLICNLQTRKHFHIKSQYYVADDKWYAWFKSQLHLMRKLRDHDSNWDIPWHWTFLVKKYNFHMWTDLKCWIWGC